MSDKVEMDRESLLEALGHLQVIVPSLDRIGSSAASMSEEEHRQALVDFLNDWSVGRRLADVRRILSEAFDDDELEVLFGEVETWQSNHRKPRI